MALDQKQSFCIRCGDIHLTETTGAYHATTNPGGYGVVNPDFGDTIPYTASFTPPGATQPVFTLDLLANPPAPNDHLHYPYVVTQAQLGFANAPDIRSGVWSVEVVNGEGPGRFIRRLHLWADGDITARVNKCICCEGACQTKLDQAKKAAYHLFKCYKNKEAQEAIDRLYKDTAACCGCN